jgi:hypothetical protein
VVTWIGREKRGECTRLWGSEEELKNLVVLVKKERIRERISESLQKK